MSASEGLKALKPVAVHHDLHRLIDALPQIVAVVEAAERLDDSLQTDPWHKLDGALAALEETLR